MARNRRQSEDYVTPVRRILVGIVVFVLFAVFVLWRIDSPRVERVRAQVVDAVVPNMEWALVPVTKAAKLIEGFQSYTRLAEQNQELRRELQRMKAWKEAAVQLEEENARLLDLNQQRYQQGRAKGQHQPPDKGGNKSADLITGRGDGMLGGLNGFR